MPLLSDHAKGLLITTLGILFIVPDSLFVRLVDADTMTIAFWRNLTSGIVASGGLLLLTRGRPWGAVRATGWQGVVYAGGVALSGVMFVAAVKLTSVANVVFILAAMPIFAALFSRIALAERIGRRMVLTMAAVGVGLAVIAYGSGTDVRTNIWGDLIALGIAKPPSTSSIFANAARTKRQVPMAPAVPFAFLAMALVLLPFADVWSVPDGQWWIVAVHGGVFIVASMTLLSIGPRYITSAEVSLLVLLESTLAPLLIWVVIGEFPGEWVLAGGAMVIGALLVSNLVALRRRG